MEAKGIDRNERYLSFLLRLWQESFATSPGQKPPQWRASLEEPKTSEMVWFATLADLFAYIENKTNPKGLDSEPSAEVPLHHKR